MLPKYFNRHPAVLVLFVFLLPIAKSALITGHGWNDFVANLNEHISTNQRGISSRHFIEIHLSMALKEIADGSSQPTSVPLDDYLGFYSFETGLTTPKKTNIIYRGVSKGTTSSSTQLSHTWVYTLPVTNFHNAQRLLKTVYGIGLRKPNRLFSSDDYSPNEDRSKPESYGSNIYSGMENEYYEPLALDSLVGNAAKNNTGIFFPRNRSDNTFPLSPNDVYVIFHECGEVVFSSDGGHMAAIQEEPFINTSINTFLARTP